MARQPLVAVRVEGKGRVLLFSRIKRRHDGVVQEGYQPNQGLERDVCKLALLQTLYVAFQGDLERQVRILELLYAVEPGWKAVKMTGGLQSTTPSFEDDDLPF